MKKTLELLPIGLLALSACTPKDAGNGYELLNQLPVVAQTVNVDGQEITVNDFNLLKDTIDLPLSFWLEDFQVVKLDDRNEASADMGPVYVSDNYIIVLRKNRLSPIPCKLYRKDGTYVGKVGNIGQGPGEYQDIYDVQIDETDGRIYFMPRNARSILVYNMQGEYIKNIPLNKKYEKLLAPKATFKVDAINNNVSVILLPFDYLPVVAWEQDLEGNFIQEFNPSHLKLAPDYSNDVIPTKVSGNFGAHIFTFWVDKKDTLYHWNTEKARLQPKFTTNFSQDQSFLHSYYEFPCHYVGTVTHPVQTAPGIFEGEKQSLYMVNKETNQGTFFRMKNDFLDDSEARRMPYSIDTGYYTLNLEPSTLMEHLEKALQNEKLSENKRSHLKRLLSLIDENDNNYILFGKLRNDFSSEKPNEALLIYNESQLKKKNNSIINRKPQHTEAPKEEIRDIRAARLVDWSFIRENNRYKDWDASKPRKVWIGATVDEEGNLSDIRVVRKVEEEELNEEALRLMKALGKVEPAIDKATGEPVKHENWVITIPFPIK